MDLTGLHHVSLNVHDAELTARFYEEVLGLSRVARPDFGVPGAWFQLGDGRQIHLIEVGSGHVAPTGQHFAVRVDDIEAAVEDLRGRGIDVSDPLPIPGAGRQSFFEDPAGNQIELNQPDGGH